MRIAILTEAGDQAFSAGADLKELIPELNSGKIPMQINLALAIFNVLPIAPLDGSKILFGLMPSEHEGKIYFLERCGPFILIGLILLGQFTGVSILGRLIWPFVGFFNKVFVGI